MLQKKKRRAGDADEPAKGPTEEEFKGCMRRASEAFRAKMQQPGNWEKWCKVLGAAPVGVERDKYAQLPKPSKGLPFFLSPSFSWDNPSVHGGKGGPAYDAFVKGLGLTHPNFFNLPVRSSYIHEVIEHARVRFVDSFQPRVLSVGSIVIWSHAHFLNTKASS